MRREFILPEGDVDYLNSSGYQWETVKEDGNWIIVHKYPVPNGYNVIEVSAALRIDPGYPVSQIDMVYFNPHLQRVDNQVIGALAMQPFQGGQWQRWSRHRTGENPWRPEVDDVCTHLSLVTHWLEREFQIR